ncbi:MAG: rod shape-determining protein MreD [Parcubacteria group bacterium CG1_02_40_82]|uniref:Rod shape-determining protein MreD n=4 Tax=Candidatus Portnoyibacteriota TaxID=1817913 RepID=A0A2M7IIW4_9BACT|nr:MAG: rod shape-determining protein MreD [Parcubacteria group bacterium CG1_02_40_82]PIQ75052.1 MAG: rod shape-determining protein MreD [Candidatus Portnoybacteria bacterium CG11_big_fil_rev_8_21_14_0_20_40_15]PIS31935.1 MAG: rod shape-determining protein MreD [Candidatus Portnoybacteria bacterium CG08_land_8_20_14_0_20_40_83]PIW76470.1 MAG: rod shape-determining protein MreD [Candidatus Portnoybacteria bacterium CG_4_8_14_3_um_filter_40_10]PIY74953.1 MAG: rod shape-determining protein MreD [
MNKIIVFLLFFMLLILQVAFVPRFSVFNVYPNILLIAILVFAIMRHNNRTLLFALFFGLALDIFSSWPFGIYALDFVILAWLIQFIGKNFFRATDFFGQTSIIALSCVLFSVLNFFLIKNFYWLGLGQNIAFWDNLLRIGLLEIILNFVLAVAGLMIFKKINGLFTTI